MTPESRSGEAPEPEQERRADPDGQPPSGVDRRQARAGVAAAYAAAQHAGGRRSDAGSDFTSDTPVEAAESDPPVSEDEVEILADNGAAAVDGGGQPAGGDQEQLLAHNLDELVAKAEKAQEYLSLAQRTQADFENYRKRAARDAALAQERGITKLAKELLPAIDNLDRALAAAMTYGSGSADPDPTSTEPADAGDTQATAAPAAADQLVSGLRLVHAELLAALARAGIEPFSPIGEQFDPQHHEAVAQAPVEGQASGTVVEVYQQGFRFGETVLRPARVLVAA